MFNSLKRNHYFFCESHRDVLQFVSILALYALRHPAPSSRAFPLPFSGVSAVLAALALVAAAAVAALPALPGVPPLPAPAPPGPGEPALVERFDAVKFCIFQRKSANFRGLVLFCIEADFCNQILIF